MAARSALERQRARVESTRRARSAAAFGRGSRSPPRSSTSLPSWPSSFSRSRAWQTISTPRCAVSGSGTRWKTTLFFVGFVSYAHFRLLRERRNRTDLRGAWRTFSYFWIRPGYFRELVPGYLGYFAPGFHPDQQDTRELVLEWRERLFGPEGSLREQLEVGEKRQAGRKAA